jgi:low temperature requirement protein LtrA
LLPPAAMAAAGVALLRTGGSVTTGVAGFAALVVAAPGMLVAGVPLRSGTTVYALAAMGSAVLWFAVGMWASRRATAKPAATWADFWREYAALALAVVLGVVVAGVAVNLLTGRAVF